MSYSIKQSTTAYPLIFLMVDSADHVTGKTGLTPTVTLSKAGAAFGAVAGAVSEISGGWYKVAGNATDSGTLGPLALHATSAGADPTDMILEVVAYDPQDSVRQGLTALPNVAAGANGGLPTGNASGQVTVAGYASGQAPLQPTTAGRTLDVATTGEAGLDFDNIKDASGAHTLTNITVPVVTTTTTATNLTTNNDKTGYGLSGAAVQAVWDALTSALTTANSIGKLLVDNINATISSRLATAGYTAPDNANIATIAAAVDTEVAAIKAKTDNLPASPAAVGSAMTLDLTQALDVTPVTESVGDALLAARADGFGKWVISGTTVTLYAADGTTVVHTFTLDSAVAPTSRT